MGARGAACAGGTRVVGGAGACPDGQGPGPASRDGDSWQFRILFPFTEGRGVNQMAYSLGKEEVNSIIVLTIILL